MYIARLFLLICNCVNSDGAYMMSSCVYVSLHIVVVDEVSEDSSDSSQKKKCKRRWGAKSRWGDSDELEKETVLSGLPTVIPSGLTKDQEEQYLSES